MEGFEVLSVFAPRLGLNVPFQVVKVGGRDNILQVRHAEAHIGAFPVLPDVESQGVPFPEWTRKNAPFLDQQGYIANRQGWGSRSRPPAPAAAAVLPTTPAAAGLPIAVSVFGRSGSL